MKFGHRVLHEARAIKHRALLADVCLGIAECVTIAAARVRHPQVRHCWEDRLLAALAQMERAA